MSFDAEFLSMMSTMATYEPFATDDFYGSPTFGTTTTFPCHATFKRKIMRTNTEEDAVSTAQIQLPPAGYVVGGVGTVPALAVDDHVVLPDGKDRRVLDITTFTDETGPQHQSASLT